MIILAGMIGVGKSTFTKMLAEKLKTEAYYENIESNPFLEKFYNDPKKWAFSLQLFFLNQRFNSMQQAQKKSNSVVEWGSLIAEGICDVVEN